MKAGKWNYKTKKYDEYTLPEGATTFASDLDAVVNCASCGKQMKYGDGYTSMEIHTPSSGFGYIVCSDCYDREIAIRREYDA